MAKRTEMTEKEVIKRIGKAGDQPLFLRILVYGKNGKGKTRFAASAPDVLLIDCNEKGTMSIRDKDVDVYYLEDFAELEAIYWYLAKGEHQYKSVAIDTATQLQRVCMKHVLEEEASRDASKDVMMPTRRDWGKLSELMRAAFLNFRNLPMHVIFTCQERTGDAEEDSGAEIYPEVSPGTRSTLCAAVDIIGRLYTKRTEDKTVHFRMLVGPSERYLSKDRSGKLGTIVKNPQVPGLIKVLSRTSTAASKKRQKGSE